ncbi:MAG: response regulator [Patescibacteria group bacterium]
MQKYKILFVDEESLVKGTLTADLVIKLNNAGYEALSVANPEKALELIERSPVDLIITERRFKGDVFDGFDFIKEVKRRLMCRPSSNKPVGTLMFTKNVDLAIAIQAKKNDINDLACKPNTYRPDDYDKSDLVTTIERLLQE